MGCEEIKRVKLPKLENNVKSYENELFFDNDRQIEGNGELLNLINANIIGKSTCIIEYKINNNLKIKGTGFLIELPIPNYNKPMKGLMTNNHILNHKILLNDISSIISINFHLEKKLFELNPKKHFIFSDPFLDITFIKLRKEELDYLGIDCLEVHQEREFGTKNAFIVQYPNGKNISLSQGKIKQIWGFNLFHNVSTDHGSSGGPLVLLKDNKIIGVHKCGLKSLNCNAATNIQTIIDAIKIIYNFSIRNKISFIKNARTPLTKKEIKELESHGLIETDCPYIFISPESPGVTPLWFFRTNHAWYWTPTEPKEDDYYTSNWLIIYPGGSLKVIGGFWDGIEPATKNIVLIHWLESTGLKYLI